MTVPASQVILYAADLVDYSIALTAAACAGIPVANVVGNFSQAWTDTASGTYLVMAVGGPANDALYFNPCGWTNPGLTGAGSTPFELVTTAPVDQVPDANYYENAAGANRYDTLKLAIMYAYYAVNGSYPPGYGTPPTNYGAGDTCADTASANVTCPC